MRRQAGSADSIMNLVSAGLSQTSETAKNWGSGYRRLVQQRARLGVAIFFRIFFLRSPRGDLEWVFRVNHDNFFVEFLLCDVEQELYLWILFFILRFSLFFMLNEVDFDLV